MELKTYDEILVKICDDFDSFISPKTIYRSNSNVIYLIFKAVAKAEEVINNLCVKVSNKFDPANCSEEDLESVANLVGTHPLKGSGSGLLITVSNNQGVSKTLPRDETYVYKYNDDTSFVYYAVEDIIVPALSTTQFVAITTDFGEFKVTDQEDIKIETLSGSEIPSGLKFSCVDNTNLLGEANESTLAFRQRILKDTSRQNVFSELQEAIKAKPYIFDCRVKFNNSLEAINYEGITIPAYHLAIFYSGSVQPDLAETVAMSTIYPTVSTPEAKTIEFASDVFVDGKYSVHVIPFGRYEFNARVEYKRNETFISLQEAENQIRSSLWYALNRQVHKDYVREADLYNAINAQNIVGIDILNIDLFVEGMESSYISVPLSKIPYLNEITCVEIN